ncbi:hypothetical protein BS17DRAFT_776775 [Gyrodon lividus]|nr:hypothetical protein BS17DRAFT_776775 [Gyrodon lividus]
MYLGLLSSPFCSLYPYVWASGDSVVFWAIYLILCYLSILRFIFSNTNATERSRGH